MDNRITAVTMGEVQQYEDGNWEPAILLLAVAGLADLIMAISITTGQSIPHLWNYRRQEYRGAFVVPQESN